MKIITKQLPNNHNIFHFGDVHLGSVLSSHKGWDTLVNMMSSEYEGCSNNFGVDMGDMIEAITINDPRFSPEKLTEPLPLEQKRMATKNRMSIKDILLMILDGNHERKLWAFGNITKEVCEDLGVEYGTSTAKLIMQDSKGDLMYKVYATHGMRSIWSYAADPIVKKALERFRLKKLLRDQQGDCAVMVRGHSHKLIVAKPEPELYLVDDGKQIKQDYTGWGQAEPYIHPDNRWYGCSGSFVKLFGKDISGYAEIFEYPPTELGFLILIVRNKKIVELRPIYLKL